MYPVLQFQGINIYLFWVCLMLAWIVFFYGLHRRATLAGISRHIFSHITSFTIGIFLFSRITYILSQWRTEKFIFQDFLSGTDQFSTFLGKFFIASGTGWYNLSLAGGIIGFFVLFLWHTRDQKNIRMSYLDIILPSFFVAAIIGYIGALIGGQIYGIPFQSFFSIEYAHKFNIVPLQQPLFPLPVLYILVSIVGYLGSLFLMKKDLPKGFIWAAGLGYFGSMLFIFEFLNGADDTFVSYGGLNANQILSIFTIFCAFLLFLRFTQD